MTISNHTVDAMTAAPRWTPNASDLRVSDLRRAKENFIFAMGVATNDAGRSAYGTAKQSAPPRGKLR